MLGLDQDAGVSGPNRSTAKSESNDSFFGFTSFLEPEQPQRSGFRIALLVLLLAALAGAGWWTYTNYLGLSDGRSAANRQPEAAVSATREPSATESSKTEPSKTEPSKTESSMNAPASANTPPQPVDNSPTTQANPSQQAAASAAVPQPHQNNDAKPDAASNRAEAKTESKPRPIDVTKPPASAPSSPTNKASVSAETTPTYKKHLPEPRTTHREPTPANLKTENSPARIANATDTGEGDFRRAEGYLYGHGLPQNCNEAVRNLKVASSKSNAKARSVFGTLYATGHCVARDLPTSYQWFALALQLDPNNQILEKDLSAIWNQMTPPERQLATRMKQ